MDIISNILALLETGIFGHIYLVALFILALMVVLLFLARAPKEAVMVFIVPVILVFAQYNIIPSIFNAIIWIILGLIFAFIVMKLVGAD